MGRKTGELVRPPGFSPTSQCGLHSVPGVGLRELRVMAPLQAPSRDRAGHEDEDRWEARGDRKVRTGAPRVDGLKGGCAGQGLSSRFPQARKPLVEKKRRARINESLQELRLLLAGTEVRLEGCGGLHGVCGSAQPDSTPFPFAQVQAKLENAEVLELTVRRVQGALRGRARGEWRWG